MSTRLQYKNISDYFRSSEFSELIHNINNFPKEFINKENIISTLRDMIIVFFILYIINFIIFGN